MIKHLPSPPGWPAPALGPSWPISVATERFNFLLWFRTARTAPSALLNPCSLLASLSEQEGDRGSRQLVSGLEQDPATPSGAGVGLASGPNPLIARRGPRAHSAILAACPRQILMTGTTATVTMADDIPRGSSASGIFRTCFVDLFRPHHISARKKLPIVAPLYRCRNWGRGSLRKLPKATLPANDRGGTRSGREINTYRKTGSLRGREPHRRASGLGAARPPP